MKRGADAVLVGGVVVRLGGHRVRGALLAWMAGSLGPGVGRREPPARGGRRPARRPFRRRAPTRPGRPGREPRDSLDGLALVAFAAVSIRQFGWIVFERGRSAPDAPPLQLRRPAAALDLRQPPRGRRAVLAREPDPDGGAAALPVRRRPADGRPRAARREPAGRSSPSMGLAGAALAALALRRWGGPFAVAGLPVRRRARGLPAPGDGSARGLPGRRRLEEPLPRPLRAAARLPRSRSPPGSCSSGRWRRRLLRGETGLSPWVEGVALGGAAARPPPHVPLRLAAGGGVGGRRRPRAGGPPDAGLGDPARRRGRPGRSPTASGPPPSSAGSRAG